MTLGTCSSTPLPTERLPGTERLMKPLDHQGNGFLAYGEPSLTDLMDDPMFGRLLASDGVHIDRFRELIAETRARLLNS